jgi:hypothetical protein
MNGYQTILEEISEHSSLFLFIEEMFLRVYLYFLLCP